MGSLTGNTHRVAPSGAHADHRHNRQAPCKRWQGPVARRARSDHAPHRRHAHISMPSLGKFPFAHPLRKISDLISAEKYASGPRHSCAPISNGRHLAAQAPCSVSRANTDLVQQVFDASARPATPGRPPSSRNRNAVCWHCTSTGFHSGPGRPGCDRP